MLTGKITQQNTASQYSKTGKPFFQPKLAINQPNDIYEQEADAVADKVMRMQQTSVGSTFFSPPVMQRKCAQCEEEEKQLQKKPLPGNVIQRQESNEPEQTNAAAPIFTTAPFLPQLTPPSLLAPTDSIDYLGIRQTLFNRGVLFPGRYLEDGQKEWVRQYLFYSQLHLGSALGNSFAGGVLKFFGVKPPGGDWNAWLSNTTTPLAVDSALSRDFPTFNEQEERRGGLPNPTIINAPALHFKKVTPESSATNVSSETENYVSNLSGGQSLNKQDEDFFEQRMGYDFSNVQVHTNDVANQSAQQLNALAYTNGNNIVFNKGQYQPGTNEGKRLLAHELTHVVQQSGHSMVQRDVVNMEPLTVSVGMPSDLSALSTPVPAGDMTASFDTAHIELNSQLPATPLPYTPGGWNGNDIANKLGQYDRIPGTDSDAVRCVQAVGLMSHIIMGPAAAISYLQAMQLQGTLGGLTPRKRTAMRVLEHVQYQIENRRGTYGEMYWAMEALHDMFLSDSEGTPAGTPDAVRSQVTPGFDMSQNMTNIDVWCNNSTELLSQAATLQPGEQFMLNTWNVSFNSVFDEAGVPTTQQRLRYTQTDERDRPVRSVSIRRIDTSLGKPAASQIDMNRDRKHGHQMLIFKDPTDSHIKMYEPELTATGNHLFDLTADASVIDPMLFHDQPAFELFEYVQLWGKMTPSATTSFSAP